MDIQWKDPEIELPKLSYVESDNENDPYEAHFVLLLIKYCSREGIIATGILALGEDESYCWEIYAPGEMGGWFDIDHKNVIAWSEYPDVSKIRKIDAQPKQKLYQSHNGYYNE